ncbi:MAG TPA: GNAT family N-acetyltransferase [Acidimicrobiales bacterium]|nr:GNAT family N-acetyltransferase [Acidimicrobiales bacterium]
MSFSEAVAIADVEQDGLPFRHVVIEDDATGRELEAQFASAGWDVDREVYMVLGDDPVVAPIKVTEFAQLSEEQGLLLIRLGAVERQPGISASGLDQLVEYARREGSLWAEERYGVLDRDGSPLAMTKLRLDGHVAWVEDVFTVPAARGRGLARALVTHVSALAQKSDANFVFLAADDNDWPKHLYESIGFRPVGYTRTFHRRLESSN